MNTKKSGLMLAVLNLIGFVAVVAVNALANILPINGKGTGVLSDQYPNLFVPAALTFSVWALIYILLAIFVVYGLVVAVKGDDKRNGFIGKVNIIFILSCVFNAGWIFTWHYEMLPVSLLLMLGILLSLIAIYLRLGIGKSAAGRLEKTLVHLPFSVYLGWITIATIANVTALLVDINWNGFGLAEHIWAVLVIAVGIGITLAILLSRRDIYYALVVDWALLGILLKRLADRSAADQTVVFASIAGLALISLGVVWQLIRKKVY